MNEISRVKCVLMALWCYAALGAHAGEPAAPKGAHHASGSFEVKLQPMASDEKSPDAAIAKMSLDKQFHGDLEATSKGAMLATGSASGNGAYVALEIVTGKLNGREGSFVLMHTGVAVQGGPQQLSVTVVPHSGTGALQSLSGRMNIVIADGKHSYEFDYTLADAP